MLVTLVHGSCDGNTKKTGMAAQWTPWLTVTAPWPHVFDSGAVDVRWTAVIYSWFPTTFWQDFAHDRKIISVKCAMTEQLMRRGALTAIALMRRYIFTYMYLATEDYQRLIKIIAFYGVYLYFDRISLLYFLSLNHFSNELHDATSSIETVATLIPISSHLLSLGQRLLARVTSSHAEARKATAIQTCRNPCSSLCQSNQIQMI